MDRLALRALAEGPRSMRPVYPEWSDVLALLDRLDVAEALLRAIKADRPSAHSDSVWEALCAFLAGEERQ